MLKSKECKGSIENWIILFSFPASKNVKYKNKYICKTCLNISLGYF